MAVRFVPSPSRTPFRDALRRQAAALAVLAIGLALAAGVAFLLADLHATAERAGFKEAAEQRVARVHAILADELHDLEAMGVLTTVTPFFDGAFFRGVARTHQERRGAAGALIWIPRVQGPQRAHAEAYARSEGLSGYQISDRDPQRGLVPAGEREEYFPNLYREPRLPGSPGLGLDLGGDPVRRPALERARDSGRAAVTGRIDFLTATDRAAGIQLFFPVYHGSGLAVPGAVEERRSRLRGFVATVLPAQGVMASAMPEGLPPGWSASLAVDAGPAEARTLYAIGAAREADAMVLETGVGPGEAKLRVAFAAPAPGFGRVAWSALAMGAALSLLLAMLVGALKARRDHERDSEARIGALLESCPDAMVVKDSALRYRMVNRAFCARSGFAPAQAIGRTNEDLFGEAFPPHVREVEEACSRTGQPQTYEFQGESDRGSRWYEAVAVPLGEGARRDGSIVVTARDITARKDLENARDLRARDALRASEDRFRALALLASDWFWEQDAELRFLPTRDEESPATRDAKRLGDRPIGLRRWEIPGFAAAPAALEAHRAALARREAFRNFEYSMALEDGTVDWFSASGEPLFGADGAFRGYRGTARNVTEDRRREERLRESEARFRALAKMSSDWYWEQDANCRFIYLGFDEPQEGMRIEVGPRGAKGRARWELPGLMVDADAMAAHREAVEQRHEPFRDFEFRIRMEDGNVRWYAASGDPVFGADGAFAGYRGTGRDITERRRAVQLERELSEQRRAVLENLLAAIIVIDERGVIETFSRQAEAIFGYAAHEVVGRNVSMLVPEPYRSRHDGYLERYAATGERRIIGATRELFGVRKDGSEVPIELGITEIVVDGRRKYTGMVRDLTARRAAQVALVASEERFRKLFEHSPDAVALHDGREIRSVNAALARLVGAPGPEALVGRPIWSFFDPQQRATAGERLRETIATPGLATPMHEWNIIDVDGRALVVESSSVALSGEPDVQVMTVMRDITGRREAEEAVRRSEARLREVMDLVPHFIFVKDRDGRYLMTNRAYAEYFGHTTGSIVGKMPVDIGIRPAEVDVIEQADARVRESGEERVLPAQKVTGPDGRVHTYSTLRIPFRFSEQHPDAVLAVSIDITEIRESERRLREILDVVPHPIYAKDREGKYLLSNRAHAAFYGRTPEEIVGRHGRALAPNEAERAAMASGDGRVLETLASDRQVDVVRTDAAGRERHMNLVKLPFSYYGGEVDAVLGISMDITDLVEAHAKVRESLALLEATLESTDNGFLVSDAAGRIVRWNHRMLQLFEMPASALEVLEAGDREALLALTRELFADPDAVREASREAAGDPAYQGTYTAVLRDGRSVERYTQPMLRDGRPAGRVWSYRDVTSRERERVAAAEREATLERRVDERTLELKKAVADLTLFTSAISHDLRAPLRAVGGFIDMAIEDGGATLSPPARRHLERVVNAVRNMNAMVEGLLALARQTRAPIHRQPVDVEALVREVFDELSQGAAQVAAQVAELRVSPCPAANADPVLLRNVLQNLVGNALKYSRNRERPVVEVGSVEREGRPAWFVRDNGAGFDPKYADKLFQPFGRLHSPREFEGTGIGLAAAQRILERHGGRIWADARPGEGATFWFSLP